MENRGVSDAENVRAECYALGIKDFDAFFRFFYVSAYETALGVKLWIITEADRSATTILLPSEY